MYYIKDEGQKHHFLTFFGVFNSSKYLSIYLGTIIGLTGVEQLQSLKSILQSPYLLKAGLEAPQAAWWRGIGRNFLDLIPCSFIVYRPQCSIAGSDAWIKRQL